MDFWHITLLTITIVSLGAAVFLFILLRRMDAERNRLESYLIDINEAIGLFRGKIDALFSMNIHYYDEVVYQFIEDTKEVKAEIDKVMLEYEDMAPYIFPEPLPPEEQEKELLGVMRAPIYPIRKA